MTWGKPGIKPRLTEADKLLTVCDYESVLKSLRARCNDQRERKGKIWYIAKRNLLLIRILGEAGLRAAEVCALSWADCRTDSKPPCLIVRGGKWRKKALVEQDSVFISDDIADRIEEWNNIDKSFASAGYGRLVGPFSDLDRRRVWQIVKAAFKGLNPRFSPHTLRHYAITSWCRVPGASPYTVAKQARLRSIDIIMRYFHSSPADQAKLVEG